VKLHKKLPFLFQNKLPTKRWLMTKGINFWGPFLGAGIRVSHTTADLYSITAELRPTRFNQNIVGVHFGGSIYAMCDPFYMGILMHHLGDQYIVWDKAAAIRFKKPGRGILSATFSIPKEAIQDIRKRADLHGKTEEIFNAQVFDTDKNLIAEVEKTVWIRNKSMTKIKV
jgi:hypothetical protein